MPAKPGFTPDVDRQLMKEAKIDEIPEYKKYVFDKVKEGLVYNKESMGLSTLVTYLNIYMDMKGLVPKKILIKNHK